MLTKPPNLRTTSKSQSMQEVHCFVDIDSGLNVFLSRSGSPDAHALEQTSDPLSLYSFIVGDEEDEGTIITLFQSKISTTAEVSTFFLDFFFHDATEEQIEALIATYPDKTTDGSPLCTGLLNGWYLQ